jgi:hypothetical protein
MEATPNTGLQINTGYTTSSPEMQYQIPFPAAGTYHVWLRVTAAMARMIPFMPAWMDRR